MHKKHVLIVGGGFGGVKAALELCDDPHLKVTLLSDRPNFRYYPTLYHTATGGVARQSSIPLSNIFEGKNIKIIQGEASKIDHAKRTLITKDGQEFNYDFAILALGVVTNYFGIKGLDKYSYGIKSLEDAEELKKHLHQELADEHKPDLNYVIVGGGPTGIELAGALPGYLREIMRSHGIKHRAIHVDLVEAAPKLIARMPKAMSDAVAHHLRQLGIKLYLGQTVSGETADSLMVNGKPLTSRTVIWTAGVTNHPFFNANKFEIAAHGKVAVDPYLQAAPDVFVLGDNANTPYSGLAQTALHDAKFVAKNINRHLAGHEPHVYRAKKPITVMPAGPHWAAVQWGKVQLYGWAGWLLRQAADFVAFRDIEPLLPASEQWISEFSEEENCPICAKAANQT